MPDDRKTSTARNKRRMARAAVVLPPIPLDDVHAAALQRIVDATGETRSGLVRRLIAEAAARRG